MHGTQHEIVYKRPERGCVCASDERANAIAPDEIKNKRHLLVKNLQMALVVTLLYYNDFFSVHGKMIPLIRSVAEDSGDLFVLHIARGFVVSKDFVPGFNILDRLFALLGKNERACNKASRVIRPGNRLQIDLVFYKKYL